MNEIIEHQMAPAIPPKDTPSSLRREAQRQRREGQSEWRNSLVAIDDDTGAVIAVLARGVVLSQDKELEEEATTLIHSSSDEEDESEEALTPTTQLDYVAAHVYKDVAVRPSSRPASILREDTFAPPPIPTKPDHLREGVKTENTGPISSFTSTKEEEGDIINGQIGVSASHAEAHRPELLRDASKEVVEEYDSDGSGSTVGGPAVKLWRKARGGKEAEARRKAKKEAKKVKSNSQSKLLPKVDDPSASTLASTMTEEQDVITTSQGNAIKLKQRGPGYWLNATKKSVMSRHLPGNSVLIEFFAGSRIGASVIKSTSPYIPKQRTSDSLKGPTVFTPTSIASIPQTGMMAYIPVLPIHLLWYFGLNTENANRNVQGERVKTIMGEDLLTFVKAISPSSMIELASSNAIAAWSSITDFSILATSWFDTGLSYLPWAGEEYKPKLEEAETGDDDAEEWEWEISDFDASSLGNNPRPFQRRKKLNPSMQGNYTTNRSSQSSYSIVHFDSMGIARRAITRKQDFVA